MKEKKLWQTIRQYVMLAAVCMAVLFLPQKIYAVEQPLTPGTSKEQAAVLGYEQDYYSTKQNSDEYFQFTTPAGHGYYKIVFSNISAGDIYGQVVTASGREVGSRQNPYSANSSRTWILDLEAGQTYYIHIWDGTVGGNYGLYLHRMPDLEGTSKADAVPMQLNTDYVWSKEVNADVDYGVFTAPVTGKYRMTLTTIDGGDLYVTMHAYASDRQIGNRINVWNVNNSRYDDYDLEAGVTYYVKITGSNDDTPVKYGLIISNQKVTNITLDRSTLDLNIYDSYDLSTVVSPSTAANKDVSYQSSNENVATVSDSGHIYARGAGTAVITCTADDEGGASASCIVFVKPDKIYSMYSDKQTTNSIRLKWERMTGANGYTIYQYNEKKKKWSAIKTTNKTSFVVSKLKTSTAYKFRIAAYVTRGSKKVYSKPSDAVKGATTPGKASFSSIRQGGRRGYYYRTIKLKAKKMKNVSGYQFLYSTSKNGYYSSLHTGSRSYSTGFWRGGTYYFKVRAYKKVGYTYYYGAYSKPKRIKVRR